MVPHLHIRKSAMQTIETVMQFAVFRYASITSARGYVDVKARCAYIP
jgi:hypothetical protein